MTIVLERTTLYIKRMQFGNCKFFTKVQIMHFGYTLLRNLVTLETARWRFYK